MPLWGHNTTNEKKPEFLNDADKRNCYATENGWVLYNSDGSASEEVIAAIGGLATSLGAPTMTGVYYPPSNALGGSHLARNYNANFMFQISWNEKVYYKGVPVIKLSGDANKFSGNANAYIVAGNNTSTLTFSYPIVDGDNVFANLALPPEITLESGVYINSVSTATQVANANLMYAGQASTTDIRPTISSMYIIKKPVIIGANVAPRTLSNSNVDFYITFSEPVKVYTKLPRLILRCDEEATPLEGGTANTANVNYTTGNATATLLFRYKPQAGDNAMANVTIDGEIDLNSAFIELSSNAAVNACLNLMTAGYTYTVNYRPSLEGYTINLAS
jgi:hypothetical protein